MSDEQIHCKKIIVQHARKSEVVLQNKKSAA